MITAEAIWVDGNVGEDWVVVDLRDIDDYRRLHIPGAVHMPCTEIAEYELRLRIYARGRPIACICAEDQDAEELQSQIRDTGPADVRILEGGVEAWAALGFPLESSPEPTCSSTSPVSVLASGLLVGGLVLGTLVSPGLLMVCGLGWAVHAVRGAQASQAPEAPHWAVLALSR